MEGSNFHRVDQGEFRTVIDVHVTVCRIRDEQLIPLCQIERALRFGKSVDLVDGTTLTETAEAIRATEAPALEPIRSVDPQRFNGATLYLASGPTRNQDGSFEVVLAIQHADGIQGLDLSLHYDASAIHG